jgi:NTE family protein
LRELKRVSSVSGGSITAGLLGLNWKALDFRNGVAHAFETKLVEPIRNLACQSVDAWSIAIGMLPFASINGRVIAAYRKHLFGDATLQSLPADGEGPRFVINATNVQSGALWRFSRPYMRDYLVGEVRSPSVSLAQAVAASSAFPPFLSPARLSLERSQYSARGTEPLHEDAYLRKPVLSDGGVYDNLGLETAYKRYTTILVSDGGLRMPPEPRPAINWLSHTKRVLDVIDNQVRSLRKRRLIDAYEAAERRGTYWGIRSHVADYGLADALPCPPERVEELAKVKTRLQAMPDAIQERLINWGYAVCDTALRKWVYRDAPRPAGFPYPARGI